MRSLEAADMCLLVTPPASPRFGLPAMRRVSPFWSTPDMQSASTPLLGRLWVLPLGHLDTTPSSWSCGSSDEEEEDDCWTEASAEAEHHSASPLLASLPSQQTPPSSLEGAGQGIFPLGSPDSMPPAWFRSHTSCNRYKLAGVCRSLFTDEEAEEAGVLCSIPAEEEEEEKGKGEEEETGVMSPPPCRQCEGDDDLCLMASPPQARAASPEARHPCPLDGPGSSSSACSDGSSACSADPSSSTGSSPAISRRASLSSRGSLDPLIVARTSGEDGDGGGAERKEVEEEVGSQDGPPQPPRHRRRGFFRGLCCAAVAVGGMVVAAGMLALVAPAGDRGMRRRKA